jgi:hypothetical protein
MTVIRPPSCRVPRRPLPRRTPRPAVPRRTGGVGWDEIARAIALLTAAHLDTGDTREEILGEMPPGPVLDALVQVSACMLRGTLQVGGISEETAMDALTTMLQVFGAAALRESAR